MPRNAVAVRIADKEYRIRSDADEEWLQRVARYVDESLRDIRERTATVDSLDVAILAALNLGQELIELRDRQASAATPTPASGDLGDAPAEPGQLAELIDFVEAELRSSEAAPQLDV